jgi:hypothetical protein
LANALDILYDGCTSSANVPINITDCYALQLSVERAKNLWAGDHAECGDGEGSRILCAGAGALGVATDRKTTYNMEVAFGPSGPR